MLADGLGVRNAARRKLEHELGIPPEDVPLESFTWITRVHYVGERCATIAHPAVESAASITRGTLSVTHSLLGCLTLLLIMSDPCSEANPFWGEHEIDWILMCKPKKMPRMKLNVNEVEAVRLCSIP